MVELYTVDRLGSLTEGLECTLTRHDDISPPFLAGHVGQLFPEGVSNHGERYFLQNEAKALIASPMLELLFEQVRRASFPERPSRFQSMFAVETLEEALQFRSRYGGAAIYAVTADITFRADMSLLNGENSTLVTSWLAHRYWDGKAGPTNAFWEWLMKCPVKVGNRVA